MLTLMKASRSGTGTGSTTPPGCNIITVVRQRKNLEGYILTIYSLKKFETIKPILITTDIITSMFKLLYT